MTTCERQLLSGNEAVALAALHAHVSLGTGYPGTPSTEILETFSGLGGRAQWAPNEKVALEVGIGVGYGAARALVTMKHVGLNVAADPLFTAAYTGTTGGLVVISADDPGMASSQNEQDNRNYARAAGLPMFEPADSQEAYDFTIAALELSEQFRMPVMLRLTTRICHSKTVVTPHAVAEPAHTIGFERDIPGRVMVPANARGAHRRLRRKLADIAAWNEACPHHVRVDGSNGLGIITSGVSFTHVREAAPAASVLKLGVTHPLPLGRVREFVASVDHCIVIEEGDPYLVESLGAAGVAVSGKPEMYRFGELSVERVRRILAGDTSVEEAPPKGKPPQLCEGCPHRISFGFLRDLECIVAGDIGCYTLGVLPPFSAMDSCVCMGASIGVGLGLRHVLPEEQARRVVSVLGDSTFVHSGLTGIAEMVYNPPPTGHVVLILDNSTTAMTGLQEHPGTGRKLDHEPTNQMVFEDVVKAMGVDRVHVLDPQKDPDSVRDTLVDCLAGNELCVLIVRRPCLLSARKLKQYEQAKAAAAAGS